MSTQRQFIALHPCDEGHALMRHHPNAFLLLAQIAMRAKWKDDPVTGLKAGQAFIGDYKAAGIHSEKAYRHAKEILIESGFGAFKGTNKGTVATLTDQRIFSITAESGASKGASKGRTRGEQGATNHYGTQSTQKLERPTLDEVKAFCVEIGLPESDGESRFYSWEANEWTKNGKPMKDWKATIRAWKAAGYMPSQKTPQQAPTQPTKPGTIAVNGRTYRT